MPNQYHRPASSHLLSHLSASNPARNAQKNPSKLTPAAEVKPEPEPACSALTSLSASRTTTGGVRITASAKLKSSARVLSTPASIPETADTVLAQPQSARRALRLTRR